MKTILITGANGFLGKHVVRELQLQNSNFSILTPSSKDLNLLDEVAVKMYLHDNRPNIILHLAAVVGGIGANSKRPADFISDNLIMGLNIYNNAQKYGLTEKVYMVGSVCSYPKFCSVPFKEDDLWLNFPEETNAPYGIAKKTLLVLAQSYRQQYSLGGAFFIPVNLFGPEDNFDLQTSHVIPALIKKMVNAKENNLETVYCWGSGSASREFLYVNDCAEVLVKALINNFDYSEPINLGTGKDIVIKDLVHLIANLIEYKGKIIFDGSISDGQPKRRLDVSRAKTLLQWNAKVDLESGLKNTIKWYKENKK